jgi:uncharacterized repeat protein (TIGR01451 family)
VVVSSNGYLTFAPSLAVEDGKDFSNDSTVPAIPSYASAASPPPSVYCAPPRLLPYHDDLVARPGGGVQQQYFAACPRASEALGGEPCTVIQWTNFGFPAPGNTDVFSFQAILYHRSFEIVFQTTPGDTSRGAGATIGIQDSEARRGILYAANQGGAVPANAGICFFEPRFPVGGPRTDLVVDISVSNPTPQPGEVITYSLWVRNSGPSPATGVAVQATLPSEVTYQSGTCTGSPGGTWGIGDLVNIAETGCDLTVQVNGGATGALTTTATVGGDQTDPDSSNNSAILTAQVVIPDDGDGVPASTEDSFSGGDGVPAFPAGDGNGDGVLDSLQGNVATLPMATGGGWITIELLSAPCSQFENVAAFTEASASGGNLDPTFDYPIGLIGFVIPCAAPNTATVRVIFHGVSGLPPTYRKYGPFTPGSTTIGWYTMPGAVFSSFRGVLAVTAVFADNQVGDDTGPDGRIVDQGGPGQELGVPMLELRGMLLLLLVSAVLGVLALRRNG